MALKRPNSFDAIAAQTTTVRQFWGRPHFYPTSPSPAVSRYIARGVRPQFVQAREGLHVHSTREGNRRGGPTAKDVMCADQK